MPHFITTMHHEGCNTCEVYALHVIEASKAPMVEISPREVKKAFHTAWLNIVHHIEDKASSESDKKVEWYSDWHDNLMDDLRLVEEKAVIISHHFFPFHRQILGSILNLALSMVRAFQF